MGSRLRYGFRMPSSADVRPSDAHKVSEWRIPCEEGKPGPRSQKTKKSIFHTSILKFLVSCYQLREVCETIKSDTERLFHLPEYEVLHQYAMEGRRFLLSFIGK